MPETRDTQPPAAPNPPAGTKRNVPSNPGVVLLFGDEAPRLVRVATPEAAMDEARRQRFGEEPVRFYDGADYGTELRKDAAPRFVVKAGQSIEDARKEARRL